MAATEVMTPGKAAVALSAVQQQRHMLVLDDGSPVAVGGKTGTAYKIEGGAYARKYVSSFVGIAPISDPRLVIAVMVDEPSTGGHYGGDVAGPVFANVMSGALRTLGVLPDDLQQVAQGEQSPAGQREAM